MADIWAEADELINLPTGLSIAEANVDILSSYLRSLGIDATREKSGHAISVKARRRKDALNIQFALACWLTATIYRREADRRALYDNHLNGVSAAL